MSQPRSPSYAGVTDAIHRVAKAISGAAYDEMRRQGFSGGWDHDEFGQAIASAAILAMRAADTSDDEVGPGLKPYLNSPREFGQ